MGHSLGGNVLMAGAALKPEYYKEKINLGIMIGPPITINHMPVELFKMFAEPWLFYFVDLVVNSLKIFNFLPPQHHSADIDKASKIFCNVVGPTICK